MMKGQLAGMMKQVQSMQENMKKMQDVRTATDAKLTAILSPAQKQQFEAMQGPKFNFPQRRGFGFGGGRRGGGGQ